MGKGREKRREERSKGGREGRKKQRKENRGRGEIQRLILQIKHGYKYSESGFLALTHRLPKNITCQ